jgi:hypothetical protein
MPGTAAKVRVSEKQLAVLEGLSRSRTAAKGIVQRALILVLGFQGLLNEQIAAEVGLNRQHVGVWRKRWRDAWESLCVWECTEPHRLHEAILGALSAAPRPGCPGKITAEQVAQILAVACESPKLSGRPITRWTHRYTRHGTITLTAGLDVVTGQIVSPTLEATRTEPEFVDHIARSVSLDPQGVWTFIVDNLNTHASESLVNWVAEQCGIHDPLGKKTFAVFSNP